MKNLQPVWSGEPRVTSTQDVSPQSGQQFSGETNPLHSWLCTADHSPGGLNLKDLCLTNAGIHLNCSVHKGYRHTFGVRKTAQVL